MMTKDLVEQLNIDKRDFEKSVLGMVESFNAKYRNGIVIDSVSIVSVKTTTIGGSSDYRVVSVNASLKLV